MSVEQYDEIIIQIKKDFGYKDIIVEKIKLLVIHVDKSSYERVYTCYISPANNNAMLVKNTFTITQKHIKQGVDKKYLGDTACIVRPSEVCKRIPARSGEKCTKCNTFVEYAENKSFEPYKCRTCIENPYRLL